MQKEYHISSKARLIFVSDFFSTELIGGAELTHEAILESCPYPFERVHSRSVTPEMVENNSDKHWLLGNISQISKAALIEIATGTRFSMIECDYLYCAYRSSHLHKLSTGQECDCHTKEQGRFVLGLFKRARKVFFMSEGQLNEYKARFPVLKQPTFQKKLVVQGSTFNKEALEFFKNARETIQRRTESWVVLSGGSWIKNQEATEAYCKQRKIQYELLGGLKPKDFLARLNSFKGLVFHPKGFDTNPRITIEAKLLGLMLDLNENVQQKDEPWFSGTWEDTFNYMNDRADFFWKNLEL